MEDTKIIELYFQRNEAAITQTSAKYGGYCYRIADNILYRREDAEEKRCWFLRSCPTVFPRIQSRSK